MRPDYFLRTARIGFRLWQEEDLNLAVGLWGDFEVTRFFDSRGKLSQAQVNDRLLKEISSQKSHGIQYWPIFLLEGGRHLGCCGLRPYDESKNVLEIGFHIRYSHWGQGYAFEAARAVIQYAFDTIKVSGLFAGHNPQNERSRYLLTKLGFRYTHDEFYIPTGLNHFSYLMTADDYARLLYKGDMSPTSALPAGIEDR
jgi:RimJ/RimL family protein N-acetyltransferase